MCAHVYSEMYRLIWEGVCRYSIRYPHIHACNAHCATDARSWIHGYVKKGIYISSPPLRHESQATAIVPGGVGGGGEADDDEQLPGGVPFHPITPL